jgi:RNA 3'-terminal phosphate cyclase (ATP)
MPRCDNRLQDQLIVFMALASGRSSMLCGEPTMHTRTGIAIAEQLLPAVRFTIEALPAAAGGGVDAPPPLYRVSCVGAGVVTPSS